MKETPMNTKLTIAAVAALVAGGFTVTSATPATAGGSCHLSQDEVSDWGDTSAYLAQACDSDVPAWLDHPSKPCHLSVTAVANWGETSAHLPQACTYGK
jgi:hypothetical protein